MRANKFTKIKDKWYVTGPCIEAGACCGEYVDVKKGTKTKEVLITNIQPHPHPKPGCTKIGAIASRYEEASYIGCDAPDDDFRYDRYDDFQGGY